MLKFGKLFHGQKEKQEEKEKQKEIVVTAPVEKKAPPPEIPSVEVKDELSKLWERWRPRSLPPRLYLNGGRPMEDMILSIPELERERLSVSLKLTQEAKRRLREIEKMETDGQTAVMPAECACFVSRDKLLVWLFVFPPVGEGEKLPISAAGKILHESNVVQGMDMEAMMDATKEENYFKLLPVAFGKPTKEGVDGYVEELYPREIVKEVKLADDGTADYRSQNYVQIIEENDVICRIHPPVEGESGIRVDGTPIKAKAVRPAKVAKGLNTRLNEEGTELQAAVTGHLEFNKGAFLVQPVLEVPGDVDYSTGNIDFPGDVHIKGNVRQGFSVRAEGAVVVDGLVEAATVEAKGDLLITCGVVGDNHAILRSEGNIRTKYLENCEIYAEKCVYADCIVTSHVFCDGSVSTMSGTGSIIGGNLTVGESLVARTLGARSGRETELCMGVRTCRKDSLEDVNAALDQLHKQMEEIDKDIAYLEQRFANQPDEPRLEQARTERIAMELKEDQLLQEKEEAAKQQLDLNKCRIECETAYPIIKLTIDGHVWTINTMRKFYKVMYDKQSGELREIL